MKRLTLGLLVITTAVSGCASYGVTRYDSVTGKRISKTHLWGAVTKTVVQGLATEEIDNRGTNLYTRKIGLESGANSTDSEALGVLGQALMRGLTKSVVPIP